MAQRRRVELLDDFDPAQEAVETVTFDYKGRGPFEIDLSQENADHLQQALQPYMEVARPVGGGRTSRVERTISWLCLSCCCRPGST